MNNIFGLKVLIQKSKQMNNVLIDSLFNINSLNNNEELEYKSFFDFYGKDYNDYKKDKFRLQTLLLLTNKSSKEIDEITSLTNDMEKAKKEFDSYNSKLDDIEKSIEKQNNERNNIMNKYKSNYSEFDTIKNLYLCLQKAKIPFSEYPKTVVEYLNLEENKEYELLFNDCCLSLLIQKYDENKDYDFLLIRDNNINNNINNFNYNINYKGKIVTINNNNLIKYNNLNIIKLIT